jgi:hypothetical protein
MNRTKSELIFQKYGRRNISLYRASTTHSTLYCPYLSSRQDRFLDTLIMNKQLFIKLSNFLDNRGRICFNSLNT